MFRLLSRFYFCFGSLSFFLCSSRFFSSLSFSSLIEAMMAWILEANTHELYAFRQTVLEDSPSCAETVRRVDNVERILLHTKLASEISLVVEVAGPDDALVGM